MNKKGFIGDVLTILTGVFGLVIVTLVMIIVVSSFNDGIQASGDEIPNEAKSIAANATEQYPGSMDFFVTTGIFGLPLVSASLAIFLDVSAILFWAVMILGFVYILVAAAFANGWDAIINSSLIAPYVSEIPMTNWIMNHYPLYALYCIVILFAAMYFRKRLSE